MDVSRRPDRWLRVFVVGSVALGAAACANPDPNEVQAAALFQQCRETSELLSLDGTSVLLEIDANVSPNDDAYDEIFVSVLMASACLDAATEYPPGQGAPMFGGPLPDDEWNGWTLRRIGSSDDIVTWAYVSIDEGSVSSVEKHE